jgi:hypothetical protein
MDQLANYGLAGCVIMIACAGIAFTFRWASGMLTKQVEARESDLAWHRAEIDKKRVEYLQAQQAARVEYLEAQRDMQERFLASQEKLEETFTEANGQICKRLEDLGLMLREVSSRIERLEKNMSRGVPANNPKE